MKQYFSSISISGFVFMIILLITTIPFLIYHYRKGEDNPKNKYIVYYSFLLYLITVFLLVIYPFPSIEEVAKLNGPKYNLDFFLFFKDFLRYSGFQLYQFKTYFTSLLHPSFYTVFLNLFMFMPLGVYLRKYFKRTFFQTFLISLVFSLFLEITQLSGLYGIYPRPYRLFDVDDLFINTLGAIIGFLSLPLIENMLPKLNHEKTNNYITYPRRLIAYILDLSLLSIVCALPFIRNSGINELIVYILYFIIFVYFNEGKTIGSMIVKQKLVNDKKERPKFYQVAIRNFIWIVFVVLVPLALKESQVDRLSFELLSYLAIVIITFGFYFNCFLRVVSRKPNLIYDEISKTHLISYNKEEK